MALRSGADGVEAGNADAQAKHAEIEQLADQASQSLGDAKVEYDQNIKPSLDELASTVTDTGSSLSSTTALLTSVGGDLSGTANLLCQACSATPSRSSTRRRASCRRLPRASRS